MGTWIFWSLLASALGTTFALILLRMASHEDRAARHAEKRRYPNSDVPITRWMPDLNG